MNELSVMAGRLVPGSGATPGSGASVGGGTAGMAEADFGAGRAVVVPIRLEGGSTPGVRNAAVAQAADVNTARVVGESTEVAEARTRVFEEPPSIEIEQVVESINSFLQSSKRALEFSVDQNSGRTVITVLDAERKKVIRQIPPETALNILNRIRAEGEASNTGLTERA